MKKKLKIAIPKGRALGDSLKLLRKAGFITHPDKDYDSRRLIFDYEDDGSRLLIVKPLDVPTFVEYGAADIGITGKDILLEKHRNVYEPLDLKFGECRIVVAIHADALISVYGNQKSVFVKAPVKGIDKFLEELKNLPEFIEYNKKRLYSQSNLRVATKYVRITEDFFKKKGINIQIVKLYGNIELAPLSGLSEIIVDLVSTGETLRQNNLLEIDEIAKITSRLIVNRASLKTNPKAIASAIESLKNIVEQNDID